MIRSTRSALPPFVVIFLGLFALTFAFPAHAQVVGGTISGTVIDSTGAAIPGAAIRVHNDETGNERHLQTGPDGRYSAPSIPVCTYTVTVNASGFSSQSRTCIPLSVGKSQNISLTLSLTGVAQTITVTDDPSVVNLSTQQTAGPGR